ncbi:hypothetical protein [Dysgonomonas sp. ZJ279]|uniref:hypothetical protein n=1 Tax=Dysgonomonas sp. ZJ279 TaxID=2709796 RepID=UPI0039773860
MLKYNKYSLIHRVAKNRKREYKSIGVLAKLEHWDFNKISLSQILQTEILF